jgi:surfeit locus 1 family protein
MTGRITKLSALLAGLLITVILSSLGYWQLQRAQLKRDILHEQQRLSQLPPQDITHLRVDAWPALLPVVTHGVYLNERQLMLANQHYKGRLGYEVITPMQTANDDIVLVVRGWLPSKPNTRSIPVVLPVLENTTAQGIVYWPPTKGLHLRQAIDENNDWPRVISRIDIEQIQAWFERPVRPYVIRLSATDPHRFTLVWSPVTLSPRRHVGYALQWFGLALVAMIVTVIIYRRQ